MAASCWLTVPLDALAQALAQIFASTCVEGDHINWEVFGNQVLPNGAGVDIVAKSVALVLPSSTILSQVLLLNLSSVSRLSCSQVAAKSLVVQGVIQY